MDYGIVNGITTNGGANGASGEFLRLCLDDEHDPIAQVINRSAHDLLLSLLPLDDAKVQQYQRSIAIQNTECRVEWERRYRYGVRYDDLMGELARAEWSARQAAKIRLAKHVVDVVRHKRAHRVFRAKLAEAQLPTAKIVSIFHKRQAT